MPRRLQRYYGSGYLHFITSSCYQRRPLLGTPHRRDLFLETLKQVRRRYYFIVVGYVVMPEHFHLLISEPERGNPSTVMQVLKQRFARKVIRSMRNSRLSAQEKLWEDASLEPDRIWQRRFYDFVVWNPHQRAEKLNYMHQNPVKRGLVREPGHWAWSSYRHYTHGEAGTVLVNEQQPAKMKIALKDAS